MKKIHVEFTEDQYRALNNLLSLVEQGVPLEWKYTSTEKNLLYSAHNALLAAWREKKDG